MRLFCWCNHADYGDKSLLTFLCLIHPRCLPCQLMCLYWFALSSACTFLLRYGVLMMPLCWSLLTLPGWLFRIYWYSCWRFISWWLVLLCWLSSADPLRRSCRLSADVRCCSASDVLLALLCSPSSADVMLTSLCCCCCCSDVLLTTLFFFCWCSALVSFYWHSPDVYLFFLCWCSADVSLYFFFCWCSAVASLLFFCWCYADASVLFSWLWLSSIFVLLFTSFLVLFCWRNFHLTSPPCNISPTTPPPQALFSQPFLTFPNGLSPTHLHLPGIKRKEKSIHYSKQQ